MVMVAGTAITGALSCTRKAWLSERFSSPSNDKAALGTLLHDLVQRALRKRMDGQAVGQQELQQQVL